MKTPGKSQKEGEFDRYATEYDDALEKGLSVSGENKNFFAQGRVDWLAECLGHLSYVPASVLDFGCGTGSATPFLLGMDGVRYVTGTDVSVRSLEIAQATYTNDNVRFVNVQSHQPKGEIDLAFCNGVFHHILPAERAAAIRHVFDSLRPGGLFAFWENNPWNPGTRYVMSRIPFDRDAIPLSVREASRRLRTGGFRIVRTDFLFFFPRFLSPFRRVERYLAKLPFGAQYQVLCCKPS